MTSAAISILTWQPVLGLAPAVVKVFEALKGWEPTHWDVDERTRLPYSVGDLLAKVESGKHQGLVYLARKKAPKYLLTLAKSWRPNVPDVVDFKATGRLTDKQQREVFDLGDALVTVSKPEFGVVVPITWSEDDNERAERYARPMFLGPKELQQYGLDGLGARTYLSSRLVERLGHDRLSKSGVVSDLDWGGIVVDLLANPWEQTAEALIERSEHARKVLGESGMLGHYEGLRGIEFIPAPKWTPLDPPGPAPL